MSLTRRSTLGLMAGAVLAPSIVRAQSFPTKVITLVVPYPAGGPTDAIARFVAQDLSAAFGQNVVVDRPQRSPEISVLSQDGMESFAQLSLAGDDDRHFGADGERPAAPQGGNIGGKHRSQEEVRLFFRGAAGELIEDPHGEAGPA